MKHVSWFSGELSGEFVSETKFEVMASSISQMLNYESDLLETKIETKHFKLW